MDEGLGTDFVIQKPDGTHYWHRLVHLWNMISADAGFGDDPEVSCGTPARRGYG